MVTITQARDIYTRIKNSDPIPWMVTDDLGIGICYDVKKKIKISCFKFYIFKYNDNQ